MKRSSKLILMGVGICAIGLSSRTLNAADIDVGASVAVSAAVTATKNSDMAFGGLDFGANHIGLLELGPNAAVGFNAAPPMVTLTTSGTPTAGQITVTSTAGTVDVTCETGGIVSDGTRAINIQAVKWSLNNTHTYTTATNTCAGLGTGAVSINTATTNNPVLYIGGQLNITLNLLNGSSGATPYNTSTGTGNPVTFRIVYQ